MVGTRISERLLAIAFVLVAGGLLWGVVGTSDASAQDRCTVRSRDTDHDGLPNCWELHAGTNPRHRDGLTDRDHDELTARDEYRIDAASGLAKLWQPFRADAFDSDRNETDDGHEDLDGDGVGTWAELLWRTDPLDATSVPPFSGGSCVTVPSSVPADGSGSVTKQLEEIIASVPDGHCLDFPAGARYRSNGKLKIVQRTGLTINGNGATIFTNVHGKIQPDGTPHSSRAHVALLGDHDLVVQDLAIRGPNPRPRFNVHLEFEAGVVVGGGSNVLLKDLTITHVYGDFVHFNRWAPPFVRGEPWEVQVPTDIVVDGGNFHVAGRSGFVFSETAQDITIENTTIDRTARSGVDFEMINNQNSVTGATLQNNTFSNINLFWLSAVGAGGVHQLSVIDNHFVGQTMQMKAGPHEASGARHSDWLFQGNDSDTNASTGGGGLFYLRHTDNVTISGNVQPFTPGSAGIVATVEDGCGYTITDDNVFANLQELFQGGTPPPPCD
jgi:hypothetical protein